MHETALYPPFKIFKKMFELILKSLIFVNLSTIFSETLLWFSYKSEKQIQQKSLIVIAVYEKQLQYL